MDKKWWGRLIYTSEGIVKEREFDSEALANAYAQGVNDAIEESEAGGDDCHNLADYVGCASDLESIDE